jgi:hypothetical protein
LYKYIKELEAIENGFKSRQLEYNKETESLTNEVEMSHLEEKRLKEEMYALQRTIRNLPYDQQVFLNKHDESQSDKLNLKKLLKEIK